MRDEDYGAAIFHHAPQNLAEFDRLLWRQDRGGLVENEDSSVPPKRFQNLDSLPLPHRELPHWTVRLGFETEAVGQHTNLLLNLRRVDECRGCAQHDVLGDRERGNETELLMHHPDACRKGIRWRREPHLLAVESDVALIRAVDARQAIHQRGLPGTVLTKHSVHRAGANREARPGIGNNAGSRFQMPSSSTAGWITLQPNRPRLQRRRSCREGTGHHQRSRGSPRRR